MSQHITFITGNAGKAKEVGEILGSSFVIHNKKYDIEEIQGDLPKGNDQYEKALNHAIQIASVKARTCADHFGEPVLTEDTSLFLVELMNPGVFIKFWSNEQLYTASVGCTDKRIFALCIFTFCVPSGEPVTFVGRCDGYICSPVTGAGANGFGWDCLFVPIENSDGRSFAQMTNEEKNELSHRRRALDVLKVELPKLLGV